MSHLTGEAGGYVVGEDRYAPDVAFFGVGDTLTGDDALPDLAIEIADIFPAEQEK